MLTKLMKYDFRSIRRFGLPMILVLAGVYVVGVLNVILLNFATVQATTAGAPPIWGVIALLSTLFNMLVSLLTSGAAIAMQIIIFVDFYQTLLTDQGYLTFTLPVRSWQILMSKVLCGSAWSLIIAVITAVGSLGMQLAGTVGLTESLSLEMPLTLLGELLQVMLAGVPFVHMMAIGTMGILLIPVSLVNSLLLYYMAIFFASVVSRKNRVVVAIASIFGVNFAYSIVTGIVVLVVFLISLAIAALAENIFLMIEMIMALLLVILAGTTVLFFWLTNHMMEKKLNLP